MRPLRSVVPIVTVVAALAAAGCGGGGSSGESKQQYAKDLQQTGQTLSRTLGQIEQQTGANPSLAQTGERFTRGAQAIDDTANRFAAIEPPSGAKAAHAKLVAALHEMADVLRRAAAAAKAGDRTKMATVLQALVSGDAARKLAEAQKELQDQGITATTTGTSTGG